MQKEVIVQSFGRAAATTAYIALVAAFLSNAQSIFGEKDNELLIPIFMLLLLVISATITSFLVLGKPITLYQSGAKKEAFTFLFATLGWLFAFLVAVGIIMSSMR